MQGGFLCLMGFFAWKTRCSSHQLGCICVHRYMHKHIYLHISMLNIKLFDCLLCFSKNSKTHQNPLHFLSMTCFTLKRTPLQDAGRMRMVDGVFCMKNQMLCTCATSSCMRQPAARLHLCAQVYAQAHLHTHQHVEYKAL